MGKALFQDSQLSSKRIIQEGANPSHQVLSLTAKEFTKGHSRHLD